MKHLFLTGGLAAGLLFAQQPETPRPAEEPRQASADKASSDKATNATAKFVHKAAKSNAKEIRAAEMASERAESSEIRTFAQKLVADHKAATAELETLAETKGVTLSEGGHHDKDADKAGGNKDRDKNDKLSSAQGAAFDRMFIEQQVKHHEKDVVEFQKAASSHPDNDVRAFANKQLPVLREHLDQARNLQKEIGKQKSSE